MNQWTDYCGYLHTGDCSIDVRGDTPSSISSSSTSSATAVTSSCIISDVTSRSASAHAVQHVREVCHKPMLGLKKCFHCPHCRYSTDRKNNLKRHLGTMHRDHYGNRVTELDQSNYHVSVKTRAPPYRCAIEDCDFNHRSLNKPHAATNLLDDFARTGDVNATQTDDVNTRRSEGANQHIGTESADVNANDRNAGTQLLPRSSTAARNDGVTMRETTQSNDVDICLSDAGTRALPPQTDDVKIHETTQNSDVSSHRNQYDTQPLPPSPTADYRNSLPQFEPRAATAYRRQSSRMFFYDRLRCTHDYNTDVSA